jgi:phage-related protein
MDNVQYYPIEFDTTGSVFNIYNNGTAPAPCVITIIPKVDFLKLVIEGLTETPITFTGLKTNQTLVIDGETRSVSVDGEDAFAHYDAWEFPKLQPGANQITIVNGISASISIEYSANYI